MSLASLKGYLLYQLPMRSQGKQEISRKQLTERVLIIGSGNTECGLAIDLAEQGKEVTILENTDEILSDCLTSTKRVERMRKLEKLVVTIFLETFLIDIQGKQVFLSNQEGFQTIVTVDNIIVQKNCEYLQNRL